MNRKRTFILGISLIILLIVQTVVAPALAQETTKIECDIDDINNNGFPDLIFQATNGLGQPQPGVQIQVTPEGAPGPLFEGVTGMDGRLVVEDVPCDTYLWTSSVGESGSKEIDPREFPISISEKTAFFMWYLAFKSEAPSGEKGASLLREIANYVGYDIEENPLPEKGESDYQTAKSYIEWITKLESYIKDNLPNMPLSYEGVGTTLYLAKNAMTLMSKFSPTTVEIHVRMFELEIITENERFYFTHLEVEAKPLLNIRGISFAAVGILLAFLDLSVIKPSIIADMQPDELQQHWFRLELDIYKDFLAIGSNFFMIAKLASQKIGLYELSKVASEFLSALGVVIGILIVWSAILDYQSKYPDSPFWEHLNDIEVWQYMLLVVGGTLIAIGSLIAFLSYMGVLGSVGLGSAITGVGIVITIIAAIIALALWIYNWWNYSQQIKTLKAQLSAALTNMFRVRRVLYAINTENLQQSAQLSLALSNVAAEFAVEAPVKYRTDFETAKEYLLTLSEAQQNVVNAVLDAREALDNLIKLYLYYESTSDPTKKIKAHLIGVNSTKADYISASISFEVNASICRYIPEKSGYYYEAKKITSENLDGVTYYINHYEFAHKEYDLLHPFGYWTGWAFDTPVEHDNQGHEFAVTYNITGTEAYFHVDNDPNNYDSSTNWKVQIDTGTFFLYKFYFDEKNDDVLNEWLETIQGEPLKNAQEKLKKLQEAFNELRIATLPPEKRIPKAVDYGLNWLRTKQNPNGSWNYEGQWYSMESVGITALTVLAFLNRGVAPLDETVKKGINYLLSKVRPDGSITLASWEAGRETAAVYETSMSILALVATHNESYNEIIKNAADYLIRWQCVNTTPDGYTYTLSNPNYGGWGYPRRGWADLSNTQWALMALDAASTIPGVVIPESVWENARIFVSRTQNPDGGNSEEAGFTYRPGGGSYGSMTAAGVWSACIIDSHLDIEITTDPLVQKGVAWLLNPDHNFTTSNGSPQNPGKGTAWFYYYLLSAVKALILADAGREWVDKALMYLVKTQVVDTSQELGYWKPVYSQEERYIMSTVEAILTLEAREVPTTISALSYLTFILHSSADLHIYNVRTGGHIGVDYDRGIIEVKDVAATFTISPDGSQIISFHAFLNDKYRVELIGVETGPFELQIEYGVGEIKYGTTSIEGEISEGAIFNWMTTVTAIAGAMKVYVTRIKLVTTTLTIGTPRYEDSQGNIYVTSTTPFSLTTSSDVILTTYRIRNETYSTGWLIYHEPFYLTELTDGSYCIDYNSTDGTTIEPMHTQIVILDNTPPITNISISEPKYVTDMIYVTPDTLFALMAHDSNGSGIHLTAYRIFNSTYDSGWLNYTSPFTLAFLTDGTYTIAYNSTDNVRNMEITHYINIILFSWDCIFEDCFGRQTILKINVKHKFFQLITPDKDYGIRQATHMRKCGITIIIRHCDEGIRLISAAIPKFDFCIAIAWDKQACARYFLLDKIGHETNSQKLPSFFY